LQSRSSISVVIPTYNRASDLKKAVASVLAQTYRVAEILVCDDGSTDNSKEVMEEIKSSRVRWIDCGRNGRPAIPRNAGIKQASSEWVAFLDSDDEWLPDKLEKQLVFITTKRYNAVCSNAFRMVKGQKPLPYLTYDKDIIKFDDLIKTNYVICSSMMVRRSLFANAGYFPEGADFKAIEDYALWLKIAARENIGYIATPLLNYTDDPAQSIRKDDISVNAQRKIILKSLGEWLTASDGFDRKKYSKLVMEEMKKLDGRESKSLLKRFFKK
jgi:teichuronic acid biosynthesis glycosyltransferase TuaG